DTCRVEFVPVSQACHQRRHAGLPLSLSLFLVLSALACDFPCPRGTALLVLVGQDGILRGDCQSPRVPIAGAPSGSHAACQAAPQAVLPPQSQPVQSGAPGGRAYLCDLWSALNSI